MLNACLFGNLPTVRQLEPATSLCRMMALVPRGTYRYWSSTTPAPMRIDSRIAEGWELAVQRSDKQLHRLATDRGHEARQPRIPNRPGGRPI
jgi:hypothetical protein